MKSVVDLCSHGQPPLWHQAAQGYGWAVLIVGAHPLSGDKAHRPDWLMDTGTIR